MPVTFFAHQAPVLPIARRWPNSVDGIALVVGTMAPDLAYVLDDSRFAVWAHGWPGLVTFCVPTTFVVSWVIARVLAPVVPAYLADLGTFHLRDYRGLAVHRFGLVRTTLCGLLGALTHVALDHFTHPWGWFAMNVGWYGRSIFDLPILGRELTPFQIAQDVGHVALSAFTMWWLWRAGARRWLAARAALVPCRRTGSGAAVLLGWLLVGAVGATLWVRSDRAGSTTDILRIAAGCFAGLTVGAVTARAIDERVAPP